MKITIVAVVLFLLVLYMFVRVRHSILDGDEKSKSKKTRKTTHKSTHNVEKI
jgi:hypothetical protein